jgi:PilZ domain
MAPRTKEDRPPRADLKWPVIVETADGSMDGVMENASSTGLFIACASPLRPKALCELIINAPFGGQRFRATAEVVWSRAGRPSVPTGMGVRFVKISGTDRRTISDAVIHHLKLRDVKPNDDTIEIVVEASHE